MSTHPELLAPAESADAVRAALAYGADAVYVGLPRFSARAASLIQRHTPHQSHEPVF